jgi:hypothetical protein
MLLSQSGFQLERDLITVSTLGNLVSTRAANERVDSAA